MNANTPDYDAMTDEELFDSPLGHRLRRYADKLLAAQEARVEFFTRRKSDYVIMAGVSYARDVISPDGTTDERQDNDPWATYRSPELEGLREAVKATDGTTATATEAARAYIASLQSDERATDVVKRPATPTDVASALSHLLTGHAASGKGPFAVHEADGFHDEPYVILSVESMRKVLDEVPKSRW